MTVAVDGVDLARVKAVALGASFGGVEALMAVLPGLRPTAGVPLLLVLHQPRERPSLLAEILGPRCQVPVSEAQDKEPVEAGHVYVAPPDYHLLVDRGPRGGAQLALSVDDLVNFSRPAIDVLFESAAQHWGPGLLALLLTGASADGAAGLQAVRRAGGQAVVQDPEEARAPVMPRAALAAGAVEAVLPLQKIERLLAMLES